MPDYINWYTVELRMRLQSQLPADRVDIITAEVESHLRESAAKLQEGSTSNYELAAIQAFGKPSEIAVSYLRESEPKLFGLKPVWVLLVAGLAATGCWVFNWISLHGYFDNYGATWQNGLAAIFGLLFLGIFVKACRAGYRSYSKQIVALNLGTAFGLIFLLSFWIVGAKDGFQGLSRIHLARDVQTVQRNLTRLDALAAYFEEGGARYATAKTAADLPEKFRNPQLAERLLGYPERGLYRSAATDSSTPTLPIPADNISAYVDGRLWGIYLDDDFARAKTLWTKGGEDRLRQIEDEKLKLGELLASAQEARSGRLFFFNRDVYGEAVVRTILFLPILLLLNTAAFHIGRRRPTWPERALA